MDDCNVVTDTSREPVGVHHNGAEQPPMAAGVQQVGAEVEGEPPGLVAAVGPAVDGGNHAVRADYGTYLRGEHCWPSG